MKIVILGCTGYVGSRFYMSALHRRHTVDVITRQSANAADYKNLKDVLSVLNPDFVINAAGYTGKPNVDACELNKDETIIGNVVLPQVVAQVCDTLGIRWGHVSSGCIYAGTKGKKGFTEKDEPNFSFDNPPCSFYSGTKALGEKVLMSNYDTPYIWRLRIPFDEYNGPRNYLTKLMKYDKLLRARNSVSHRREFVEACFSLAEDGAPRGIYNVCNPGSITTEQVVKLIKKRLKLKKKFEFFDDEDDFMGNVKTYRSNCVMDVTKLLKAGVRMSPVQDALDMALKDWKDNV